MKKILAAIIFTLVISLSAFAQSQDEKDSLAAVNKLFTEMANFNPPGIIALYTPESQLVAIIKGKDGKTKTEVLTREAFSKFFAEKKGEVEEAMYAPEVKVDGDLAIVFGRYVFFVNGKLSHCGVDSFHLIRTDDGWKIANGASTIDPTSCTEAEKALKSKTIK